MSTEFFTDDEIDSLVRALGLPRGEVGFTEGEMELVFKWAHEARTIATLLEMVLAGEVFIDVMDGEVMFHKQLIKEIDF